ncbi:hypothetical protein [Roseibium algae]|uniref:Uncharacterized protein n=1 Tax=Roseibium algae TaxID=3123038 RepID=A0ABU8TR29_9HYPH
MIKTLSLTILSTLIWVAPAAAIKHGKWNNEKIQGFEKYWTDAADGSRFTIWCHKKRKYSGTVVDIDIDGKNAPPSKEISIVIDRKLLNMTADEGGYVQTDCATCADGYKVLWNRLRSGSSLAVKFKDNRYAAFSLKGAREILSKDTCPADFYK